MAMAAMIRITITTTRTSTRENPAGTRPAVLIAACVLTMGIAQKYRPKRVLGYRKKTDLLIIKSSNVRLKSPSLLKCFQCSICPITSVLCTLGQRACQTRLDGFGTDFPDSWLAALQAAFFFSGKSQNP